MDIHERLRYLREKLNLTTRAFGASIHMSGGSITNMEKGVRNITDRTIRDICREYHVNPDWLIHGDGPVFEDPTSDLTLDDDVRLLTRQILRLSHRDRELVKKMIEFLSNSLPE